MEYQLSFLFASILLEGMRSYNKKQLIWEKLLILKILLQQLPELLRGVETLDYLRNSQDFPGNISQFLEVSRFPGIQKIRKFNTSLVITHKMLQQLHQFPKASKLSTSCEILNTNNTYTV